MRCEVEGCVNNCDGYCLYSSYVTINRDGECDCLEIQTVDLGLKTKEDQQ